MAVWRSTSGGIHRPVQKDHNGSAIDLFFGRVSGNAFGERFVVTTAGESHGPANLVIVAGAEGLALDGSRALMQAAANFLIESGHTGRADSGLLAPFPGPNGMGLHYMGFAPETTLDIAQNPPDVLIVAQADLLLDDPAAAEWLRGVKTIISLTLFEDGLSALAAVAGSAVAVIGRPTTR